MTSSPAWLPAFACNVICLWTLSHCLSSDSPDAASVSTLVGLDVRISVSVSEHFVTLSCDVAGSRAGADDHKVQFFCPVLPDSVQCYGDCSPICTMQTDGSCRVMDPILESEDVACQKAVSPPDGKSVRLRIDTRRARLAGQWRCKFRGSSSATVQLSQFKVMETVSTTEAGGVTEPPPRESKPTSISLASGDQHGMGVWKPDARKYPGEYAPTQGGFERDSTLARFARTDYIIGVLTIMSVSLVLNLGFCIRCLLARHYVETRKRNQRKPLGWLGSCLCVSTVQVMLDSENLHHNQHQEEAAGNAEGADRGRLRRRRDDGVHRDDAAQGQRLLQQQQPHCLYCMQADCRILYDEVARGSECGSSCRGGVSGGGSFRLAATGSEGRGGGGGRCSQLGVPMVPEEAAAGGAGASSSMTGDAELQEDTASDISAGPGSRLELSRRMLRKADTLLREANSLLLETDSATDQQPEQ